MTATPCRYCGAGPGQACRSAWLVDLEHDHPERVAAADVVRREAELAEVGRRSPLAAGMERFLGVRLTLLDGLEEAGS